LQNHFKKSPFTYFMKMKLSLITLLTFVFMCITSVSAQTTRVKNDQGRWILIDNKNGSWKYEEDVLKKDTIAPVGTVDIPRPAVSVPALVVPETPPQPTTQKIIVDGVEMIVPIEMPKTAASAGIPPPVVIAPPVIVPPPAPVVVPAPKAVEIPKEVVTESVKEAPYIPGSVAVPIRKDTNIVQIDTTKKAPNDAVGSEFATPEDEYRTKAAAAGASTKQDDALNSARVKKPKKEKKDKKTAETEPEKQNKPQKPKKVKQMPSYCALQIDEIDEFTGKEKKIGKPITLFSFTPEAARKYMRSEDYLSCTANFSRIGAYKTLHLTITIDSQFGQSEYGSIADHSSLIIKMIDGSTVELYCDKGDVGRVDKIKNQTIYSVFYIVEPSFERQLNNGEASRVRLVWSVGFEDYELYDVDFFTKQITCIN
jgi:hypothetical protein